MSPRRAAGGLLASAWLAGCVAILDVDAEDYADLDEAVCSCVDAKTKRDRDILVAACEEVVQNALDGDSRSKIISCVENSQSCGELDGCLQAAYRSPLGGLCFEGGNFSLLCRVELTCMERQCVEQCSAVGLGCGDDTPCCEGLTCEGDTCCAGAGRACEDPSECCPGTECVSGVCVTCGGDLNAECGPGRPCCESLGLTCGPADAGCIPAP
jgi:hypothetical protein